MQIAFPFALPVTDYAKHQPDLRKLEAPWALRNGPSFTFHELPVGMGDHGCVKMAVATYFLLCSQTNKRKWKSKRTRSVVTSKADSTNQWTVSEGALPSSPTGMV